MPIPKEGRQRGYGRAQPAAPLAYISYYRYCRNMKRTEAERVARFADMLSAMGAAPRLRIVRLLLAAHPEGLVVGDIQDELDIPASTLSHHLDKLKNENMVTVRREGTFLWYTANCSAIQELLAFLFAECCTRNQAIQPERVTCCR